MSASERKIAALEAERDAALALVDESARLTWAAIGLLEQSETPLPPNLLKFKLDYGEFLNAKTEGVVIAPALN